MSLQDWITELQSTGDVTAAEAQQLTSILGRPKASALIEAGLSRQSDYTRKTQELATQRRAFEEERTRVQGELADLHANLERWRGDQERAVNQTLQEAHAAQQQRHALENSIRNKCAEWGMDPSEFGVSATATPPPTPVAATAATTAAAAPPPTDSRFALIDDTRNGIIQAARIPLLMSQINAEHMALFGTPLPDGGLALYDKAIESGGKVSLRQLWEKEYDVPTARQKKDDETRQQQITEAEQRGYQKAVSEHKISAPRPADMPSPILERFKPNDGNGHSDDVVANAVSAWRSGKYRNPGAA